MNKNKLNNINNSGFKIPENYFQELEDAILAKTKLAKLPDSSGFKVPENYFKTFNVLIKNEVIVVSIFSRKNIILASSIAAAIVLFFSLNIFNTTTLSINDLNTQTVDNYILNETNASELAALFLDNELNETQFIDYNISNETLDDYLESAEVNELF